MKVCTKCGQNKLLTEYHKTKKSKSGYRTACKSCTNLENNRWYHKVKEENGERLKSHRESGRKFRLEKNFNLSIEDYNNLLKKQNHCCAVCNTHEDKLPKRMAVDHAHKDSKYYKKGNIRGLLCEECNFRLIANRTDPEIFERAALYITGKLI